MILINFGLMYRSVIVFGIFVLKVWRIAKNGSTAYMMHKDIQMSTLLEEIRVLVDMIVQ